MERDRQHALLIAASILAARELAALRRENTSQNRPKCVCVIADAVSDAEKILSYIERHFKEERL